MKIDTNNVTLKIRKMKKQIITIGVLAVCAAVLCGCSNNEETDDTNKPEELNVNTSIKLSRAIETGTSFASGQYIAVYANSTNTNATTNNYAVYQLNISTWGAIGSDKIYLSAEPATIYAHYPAYTGSGTSSPLKVNSLGSGVTANSTVNISTFEGTTGAADNNNKITVKSSDTNSINAAPGEVDYMYATKPNESGQPQASNGKSIAPNTGLTKSVNLQMNHALAMVSFRVYKDANYKNTGKLTKIELKNVSGDTPLGKAKSGNNTTMKIGDGSVTLPTGQTGAAVYTRFMYTDTTPGYIIKTAPAAGSSDNSPAFSILVFPLTSAITANSINAIFTIDDTPYTVNIPSGGGVTWEAGKNYIYTVTMNSIELVIGTVSIKEWSNQTPIDGGNLVN